MVKAILALLRGLDIPPAFVALARGALEAGLMAGAVELLVLFQQTSWNATWWAPVVWIIIRQAEGIIDHIDPEKNRGP
jgi:hypothetical protein